MQVIIFVCLQNDSSHFNINYGHLKKVTAYGSHGDRGLIIEIQKVPFQPVRWSTEITIDFINRPEIYQCQLTVIKAIKFLQKQEIKLTQESN